MSPLPGTRQQTPRRRLRLLTPALIVLLLAGCSTQRALMPTPTLYAAAMESPFADQLPAALRTGTLDITYATDRVPEPREDGRLDYGIARSLSLAVGVASVSIGVDVSWAELVADASTAEREEPLYLSVDAVEELARTPDFPLPFDVVDGRPVVERSVQERLRGVAGAVQRQLGTRIAYSPRKEILLYVHGVSNTFDDAL